MLVQQLVLLEKTDIAALKSGTTLTIQIGGADVTLGYANASKKRGPYNKMGNGHAVDDDDELETKADKPLGKVIQKIPCPACGKPYDPRGLHIHMRGAHPNYKRNPPAKRNAGEEWVGGPASKVPIHSHSDTRPPTPSGRAHKTKKKSKYRGVHWHSNGKRWRATYYDSAAKYSTYIKSSLNEKEAAQFYDDFVSKKFGDKAVLNFPKTK